MWLKKLLILIATAVGMLLLSPSVAGTARADLLQCPYPATGFQVRVQPLIGEAIGYVCNYPIERGLQHLHAEYGGYMTGGGTAGIPGLNGGSFGVRTGVGMIMWSQSWRCPDERYIAAPPNGVGAWRDPLDWKGIKCPAVERAPLALNAPWPPVDPNIVLVVNSILPPGEPDPTAAPPPEEVPPPPPNPIADGSASLAPVPVNPVPLNPNGT
jgi:hypothetical protein